MKLNELVKTPTSIKEKLNVLENFNISLNASVYGKFHGAFKSWELTFDFLSKQEKEYIEQLKPDKFILETDDGYRCYARINGDITYTTFFDANGEPFYTAKFTVVEVVK